jgi:HEPN domain-containing protein
MKPEIELIAQWLAKADGDLRMAELTLNSDEPVYWAAAFHAQQAAEKLLKALLTFHGVEFEKSHSIDYLLELCAKVEPEVETLRPTATNLTDFAVESRYPLPRPDPTEAESTEAVEIARQIRRFVHEKLPQE